MEKQRRFIRIIAPTLFFILLALFYYKLVWFADTGAGAGVTTTTSFLVGAWLFVILFLVFAMPLFFWTNPNRGETKLDIQIQKIGNYAQDYFSYIFFALVIRDFIWILSGIIKKEWISYDFAEAQVILFLPPVYMLLGRIPVAVGPFIRKVSIKAPTGTVSESFKIVQISDLHIGPGLSLNKVKKIIKMANDQNADFIFLTGDIIDHLDKWFMKEIGELAHLRAKYGVCYIPGNHEYYWGYMPIIEKIKKMGITVLLNESTQYNFDSKIISVSGLTDFTAKYFNLEEPNPEKALLGTENSHYRILLVHQPRILDEILLLQKKGKIPQVHLQLSGHTHGGQFIPWSLIIRLFQKYTKGIYKFGHTLLYVSQGTGFWGPPDRLGTIPELTVINVTPY